MTTYTLNQLQLDGLILNCGSAVGKEMLRNLQPNTQEPIMWRTDKRLNGRYTHADQSKIPTFNVAPGVDWVPLHTHPAPQAKPLTDEQIESVCVDVHLKRNFVTNLEKFVAIARAIEAAHNIGVKP